MPVFNKEECGGRAHFRQREKQSSLIHNLFRVFCVFRGLLIDRASRLQLGQPRKTRNTRKDNARFQQGKLDRPIARTSAKAKNQNSLPHNPFRVFCVFRGLLIDRASQLQLGQPRKTRNTRKENARFQQGKLDRPIARPSAKAKNQNSLPHNPFRVFCVFRGLLIDRASRLHLRLPREKQKTRKDNALSILSRLMIQQLCQRIAEVQSIRFFAVALIRRRFLRLHD
ncbi:hypothetical protein FF011L_36630 [Roseimaritima multifibrata]|uniref:Uncharacterized protein n=1 Tax=Roseimaritima multifibrata TaxID=1930274 RepID=A0A517MJ07_9BACT|nr:hypothetical protein [Roseimaritima multifibrata]QDS94881.1 hypothetical protein FF011L_36630 [Roseimaritima multifibrata]